MMLGRLLIPKAMMMKRNLPMMLIYLFSFPTFLMMFFAFWLFDVDDVSLGDPDADLASRDVKDHDEEAVVHRPCG